MSELIADESSAEEVKDSHTPTLLEQMGGISGLISATLPVLVLVPINSVWGMKPALLSALAVAVLIAVWRIARKQTVQPAISGLLGVALCAAIAWYTGSAKGYFLYGIWVSLVLGVVSLLSIIVRWPGVGVVWNGLNGEAMTWRTNAQARRFYAVATAGWAAVFLARFGVQYSIYNSGDTTTELGFVRIAMGWPLTALVSLLTVWAVRKAKAAMEGHAHE